MNRAATRTASVPTARRSRAAALLVLALAGFALLTACQGTNVPTPPPAEEVDPAPPAPDGPAPAETYVLDLEMCVARVPVPTDAERRCLTASLAHGAPATSGTDTRTR